MKVALRPLRRDDAAMVLAWRNAPEVAAHMYIDHAVTSDEHARWLEAVLVADDRRYWIVLMDEAPVGLANVIGIDRDEASCAFGFYLGEASARGTGAATAAMALLIDQVFGPLGLERLTGEALAENALAQGLYERLGFEREGLLAGHVVKGGAPRDVIAYGMGRADWSRNRPGIAAGLAERGIELPAASGAG